MINHSIPAIIQWIIQTYGKLIDGELFNREQNLTTMTYDTTQPVDFVFNKIDTFYHLEDLSGAPVSDQRKHQYAYVIFQKSRSFLDSLKKWNEHAPATKTYDCMKEFMRDDMAALEAVGALNT